jgi:predicted acetyltransferase
VIYGRFGYGIAAPTVSMEAEHAGFAFRDDPGPTGKARLVSKDEARALFPPIFERARLQRHGTLSRSEARWNARVQDPEHWRDGASPKYYVLIELEGQGEAFAMYRIKEKWERGMPQSELVLVDAIATSTEATRELWRYLFGVDLIARVSMWNYDPATPLFLMVRDARRLQLKLADGIWLRLVEVGDALRLRSYAGDGSVVLEVTDVFCPWNEGRYRAGGDAGATDDPAELRLSAADLASTYLGAFSFERLAAAGRVEELADGAIARASALFRTALPPHCLEPF